MQGKSNGKWVAAAVAYAGLALTTACGGGGGGGGSTSPPVTVSPPPPPPPPATGITYQAGVYEDSSTYENQCQVVRTGTDIEGNPFPDQAGSVEHEKFWLRSWTDETYLWRTEVPDLNPNNSYANTASTDRDESIEQLAFFQQLKTSATTASGADKDYFHFSQPTADYLEARNSIATPEYGAYYAFIQNTPPRDLRIRYTEPNSPASDSPSGITNLNRGTRILEIDGIDLVNTSNSAEIDALNAALYPTTAGETHTFVVQDAGSSTTRTITLSAENISEEPVNQTNIINTPSGDVGYIHFTTFSPDASEAAIRNAMISMNNAGVSDLVLDLRYNGGGLLGVASELAYMVAGPAQTNNKTFELLRFNDAAGNVNPVTGRINQPIPFLSTAQGYSVASGTSLPALNLSRVFILSTGSTCSASEAVINGLRGVNVEVILIGDTTCGKPYGFYPTSNCGETYYTIQFQGVNDVNFGDYADGFIPQNSSDPNGVRIPGCQVTDNFDFALGDVNEPLLAAALQYRNNGTCPAAQRQITTKTTYAEAQAAAESGIGLNLPAEDLSHTNRDMSTPTFDWEQNR